MTRIRSFLILPVLAVLATPALAAGVTVTNNSGLPIDELFSAAPGTKEWSPNLMEGIAEGALDTGKAAEISAIADGVYDLRVSAPDEGVLCYMEKVEIKDAKVELTEAMGKACK